MIFRKVTSMKKSKIKVSFPALLMFITPLLFGRVHITLAVLLSAVLHEAGHILASVYLGVEISSLSLDLLGAKLCTAGKLISYKQEIALCLAGPMMNFITFTILFPLIFKGYICSELAECTLVSSAILGCVNMLPISSFDGGRVVSCLLSSVLPYRVSNFISNSLSIFCVFCLWCISVYLLVRAGSTLTLFVFSLSVFTRTAILEE